MNSRAVQFVFASALCAGTAQTWPKPPQVIARAFLSARQVAVRASAVDRLVKPHEVARFKLLSGGVPGTGVGSNPMTATLP